MNSALEGITVLDFSQMMQGPLCSQMLGDLGAEVIKVERPKLGDLDRQSGMVFLNGVSTHFLAENRNKKSITVNLKEKEGKKIIYKLVKKSDVVLQNFRPGVMERLGLGCEKLSSINARIVYCSLSGYGERGPSKEKPGQDLLAQAMSGIMSLTGEAGGFPTPVGTFVGDAFNASLAAFAIMVALFYREKKGAGQKIELCLLNAQIAVQCTEATTYLNTGEVPRRGSQGTGHCYEPPPYGVYETKDGYIAISSQWSKTVKAMGLKQLEDDPRFASEELLFQNRDKARKLLAGFLRRKTRSQCLRLLEAEDIWCAPVYDYGEVFTDPQVKANKMVVSFQHPIAGEVRTLRTPIDFEKTPVKTRIPPPTLGQHTEEILSSLGYAKREIDALRDKGVI